MQEQKNILKKPNSPVGACSVVIYDNLVGRNLDWLYSEMADLVTITKNRDSSIDSIGVAGAMKNFTKPAIENHDIEDETHNLLPFYMQDGINKHGVCVSTLVVPNIVDKSIPLTKNDSISSIMVNRYILDNCKHAFEAVNEFIEDVEIYFPKTLREMGYNQQWVVCDKEHKFLLQVNKDGDIALNDDTYHSNDKLIYTNFQQDGVKFNEDGKLYTPSNYIYDKEHDPIGVNKLHEYASGIERYNTRINDDPSRFSDSLSFMKITMELMKYTTIYHAKWYSEFVGGDITLHSPIDAFEDALSEARRRYSYRSRDSTSEYYGTWNTNHSTIYNLETKEMYISSQEDYSNWIKYDNLK